MKSHWLAPLFGTLSVLLNPAGCSRADLNVITDESAGGSSPARSNSGGSAGLGVNPSGSSSGRPGSSSTNQTASGCPSPALAAGDTSVTLQVGALSRSYVLHVPTTYSGTKPVPLLLDFHGVGSSGWGELSSSPYPAVTDREGVIIAFPDGLKGPAGTGWNVGPCCVADVDDVAFARAVVSDVSRLACIDAARVYAAGVLTGGGMAHYLGCRAADLFAAVAPAAFDLLDENVNDCRPSQPITVISFRGTAVSRVPYEGGESSLVPNMPITFLGAKATFEQWAKIDGCTGSPSSEDSDGCSSYSGCPAAVEVILCTKTDGREEPGDASIAWPVLKRHSR